MFLNQKGDTIVEVLMCIAIISAVVGGAYTITNRNVRNTQQAQEHAQALKIAETQLEQLKSYISEGKAVPIAGQNFCMKLSGVTPNQLTDMEPFGAATLTSPLPLSSNSSYPTDCKKNDNGVAQRYMTGIRQESQVYTVYISWDGPTGGRDQVSLSYRVYP